MEKIDVLNREQFVKYLVDLTENISANKRNVSFAINGDWGCGKSFVLDMYENQLGAMQSEETAMDKYFIIRYNCWKFDYYEDPLVAIVAAIIDSITEKTKLIPNEKQRARVMGILKTIGTSLASTGNNFVKEKTGINIQKAISDINKNSDLEKVKIKDSHNYDPHFSFTNALNGLQKQLNEIAQNQTIVFIVDELDRCLPDYAIKILERLHHLTEKVSNIATIIAIDKKRLVNNVQHAFGLSEKDANQYLKKFIQFEIPLNIGEISERISEKYSDYIKLFDDKLVEYDDSIEEFLQVIFQEIEVRRQEQIINKVQMVHQLLYYTKKDYSFMCVELLIAVLTECYNGEYCFTQWFSKNKFLKSRSTAIIPFDYFFETKFSKAELTYPSALHGVTKEYQTLTINNSFYEAILFIWYWLFLDEQSILAIRAKHPKVSILQSNIEELKKFSDMIRFIQ